MTRESTFIEVKETGDHGKVLVSTEKLEPGPLGLPVFREEALMTIPKRGSKLDNSGRVPELLAPGPQMWTDWWFFQQQREEIKHRVLRMYAEMNCPHAMALRSYLQDKARRRQQKEEKSQEEGDYLEACVVENIEDFIALAMVIRFNAVELCPPAEDGSGPGTDYGLGLFETACKMSHSCKPNCVWITTPDGKAKEIRAIAPIEEGEELTVDYVGQILCPVPERRQELLASKSFLCECDRCAAQCDDTRRFKCIELSKSNCSGVHLVHQALVTDTPDFLPCSKCRSVASDEYMKRVIQEESELWDEVRELDEAFCGEFGNRIVDLKERIERLDPPHRLHSLADKCYQLQGELYSFVGEYRSAAKAYSKQINCRLAILGNDYHSQTTAFCCEKLGDALQHVNVGEAEEAYKRAVRELLIMRGGALDPYSKCATSKLLDIQKARRLTNNALPNDLGFEGIAEPPNGPPTTDYPCLVCGNPSAVLNSDSYIHDQITFCCDEHRRVHFAVASKSSSKEETKFWANKQACVMNAMGDSGRTSN